MSSARNIRDGILERLPKLPFFRTFKFSRSQAHQVMPTDLPYAAVYLMPEVGSPDGDLNASDPTFRYESNIGISVMLKNIEAEELEDALDVAYDVVMIGLLTDASFMGFLTPYMIEGISKIRRQNVFGTLGSQNETPVGELKLDLTFVTRFDYPPNIVDELKLIHLETAYPSLERAPSTQQVIVPIDLTVESPHAHEDDVRDLNTLHIGGDPP
jgi:hypothetical protein